MLPEAVPPKLGSAPIISGPPVAPWRTWLALLLLGTYPLLIGIVLPELARRWGKLPVEPEAILPKDIPGLLWMSAENLLLFGVLFGVAWLLVRPTVDDLHARWPRGWKPWAWSVAHSVGLRLLAAGATLGSIAVLYVFYRVSGQDPQSLENLRPKIENLITPEVLRDPLYLLVVMTLVSFVVAGLREELWRMACLRFGATLLPAKWRNWKGEACVVVLLALVFGLGHWPQGPAGVLLTTTIGLGLGAILVFHRSLWIAVLAHGFFDATSFLFLRLADHFGWLDQLLPK